MALPPPPVLTHRKARAGPVERATRTDGRPCHTAEKTEDLTDTTTSAKPSNPNFIENDLDRVPDKSFRDYPLDDRLVDALEAKGISHPFPIQELTLPVALKGQDIIGQARTGTGKTLGFGLPMIQRLDPDAAHTQALIITPTRELAIQVYEELRVCEAMGYTSCTVYGGVGYDEQIEALEGGVDIVVGTPGRLLDMIGRGHLDLSKAGCVILDEADEMLDMGFLPDVERILDSANTEGRHTMLFSATMPASVVKLARRYTDSPLFMGADSTDNETAPTVDQYFFQVYRMDKPRVLARILQQPGRGNAMVFCRTKAMADRLVRELDELGVSAIAIHGDIRQASREKNLDKFRSAEVDVLCATEVAARGIDVENVTHVVNYDLPDDETMYLHRIGRTARAGAKGAAITFAEHNELARLHMIKKAVDQGDNETLEIFSTSDELDELFDLPEETPWGHLAKSSGRSGGSRSGGGSGSGGRGSRSRSRGSLDSPRGEKHDADLESDHDRDRDRTRRRGRSLDARIEERARERDDSADEPQETPSDRGRSDDRGSSDDRRRSRSRARSSDSSGSSSRDRDRSRSRSRNDDGGSSSSSRSSSGGRVRARGGKPVDGSDRDGGDKRTSDRKRSSDKGGRSESSGSGSKGGGGNRNRNSGRGGKNDRSGNRGGSKRDSGNRSGGNRGRGNDDRSKGSDAGSVDLPRKVRTTRSGAAARGEGSPRLERRVEIEQLP